MASLHFSVGGLFGNLSDATGSVSGLALSKNQIFDILERNGRLGDFRERDDDDHVRLHSTEYGELAQTILYGVGVLESDDNVLPMATLMRKFGRGQIATISAVGQEFAAFFEGIDFDSQKYGDKIDPTKFITACFEKHGKLGLEMSMAMLESFEAQRIIQDVYFPRIDDAKTTIELNDLFNTEKLAEQAGTFFDQRFINYLSRNFEKIDEINWRKFEYLTAEWFARQGMQVDPGPGRNDDGIDVRIWPKEGDLSAPPVIIVQCKRQKEKISKVIVKSLYSDVLYTKAVSGLIVTTSQLSPGARQVCQVRKYPVAEASRHTLRTWIGEMRKRGTGVVT